MFALARLSVMMFVFYFAIGAWAVTLSTYLMSAPIKGGLYFTTSQVGWIYSTFAFGGILAPLMIGFLADRLFPSERILGVTQILCGVALLFAGRCCEENFPQVEQAYRQAANQQIVEGKSVLEHYPRIQELSPELQSEVSAALDRISTDAKVRELADGTFSRLFLLMLVYCVLLQIGLTLTTVIAMRNLPNPGWFSWPRLFGTVGWIFSGLTLGSGWIQAMSADTLFLAAGASTLLGFYAFTLPHTPPRGVGRSLAESFGLPALKLFQDPSFGVFVGVVLLTSAMNQFYGVYAHRFLTDLGIPRPERIMTIGQVCEAGCMFVIPFLNPRRRMKILMLIGLSGWVLRGCVMTWGSIPVVIAVGVPMHGWSFAFFHMVAATYLDREAPPHLRASAQGIITFASGGMGVWLGNLLAGQVVESHRTGTVIEWSSVWIVPLFGCALALVLFFIFFKPPREQSHT